MFQFHMKLCGRVEILLLERFNSCNFIIALIESGRRSSLEFDKSSLSKLMRFPIELGRDLLHSTTDQELSNVSISRCYVEGWIILFSKGLALATLQEH